MAMLNFYLNRAGTKLSAERKRVLACAKIELRKLFTPERVKREKRWLENFGQVNIGYIPANKTQKQENEKTWGPSRRFEPRKIMRGQCNTLSVIEYHTSSQHLRSQPRAAQAVSSQL